MKILFLITGLGVGGAERQVCDLADKLAQKGHSIKIVSLASKVEMGVLPKDLSINVQYLNMSKNPLSFILTCLKLKDIIKDFQPDIVHSHMFHANIVARVLRLFVSFPKLICTAHNTNEGGQLRMLMYRLTNHLAELNTNVSQEAVDAFVSKKAIKKNQMVAISNGIDTITFNRNEKFKLILRDELGIDALSYVFLAVGRLHEQKDYPNLLNAFSIVKQQKNHVLLLIAGIGELESELKELSSKLGLTDSVKFLGLRRDIPKLMNVADTYVMSSHFEGLPLVLGEAMACENVIVATDCGGTREIIDKNGFLVPIRNSQALADKMLETMDLSQEQREDLGKRAREHIEKHYSLDAITDKWLEFYRK